MPKTQRTRRGTTAREQADPTKAGSSGSSGSSGSDVQATEPAASMDQAPYPVTEAERAVAMAAGRGKRVTAFQFRVYDTLLKVPKGRVTTYKHLAEYLGTAPRAVGQALRNNPYAPYVPCHRVVATSFALGGFMGSQDPAGAAIGRKRALLAAEGVEVDQDKAAGGWAIAQAVRESVVHALSEAGDGMGVVEKKLAEAQET
ncbi:methylated-DNA-[protein]-cysteine S-methyltransferase [Allomyces macrogynus ATCC 38327]|uniref:Methylated-DNA--protein-cysteine methyltransferase n=1 Tax=Allomyces macrogynus (strain ATCC 38327) TaxID=578462 RepID=A0A0L0SBF8_ALLM3|nr:methylated-DNA-[protein]-cysteine S-methyltransferase [Allomyces macrogynus ATCC 38327]|eukprot:KNE59772.1 methylated-DNA-[protein]-cysteine S-methyltransferase [Allomyces macrogynus ATCC 38327]